MGKDQKKRAMRRHNPIRVPDSHLAPGLAAATSTSTRVDAILPVIQKLESSDAIDRAWACAAVSNLINNDPSTRRLLQGKNIVGHLISRLSDTVDEVVVESSGALRNLCIDGGYDVCAEMYNKNLLDPLKTLLPKISAALATYVSSNQNASNQNVPQDSLSLVFQLAENVITLFWCLSETSNKALNSINNLGLVPFLMSFLSHRQRFPMHLLTAAAQCIYVLSDDNTPVIEALRVDSTYSTCLFNIVRDDPTVSTTIEASNSLNAKRALSLRVLTCGILKNVSPLPPQTAAALIDLDRTIILPLLTPIISISLLDASNAVYAIASQPVEKRPSELKHAPLPDHKSPGDIELEVIETQLRTVQLSLEILTGICASLDDTEPTGDQEIYENEDLSEDEHEGGPNSVDMDVEPSTLVGLAPPDTISTRTSQDTSPFSLLIPPLMSLAHPTPLSFPPAASASSPSLSVHPPTTSVLGTIHVRALECLNNIFIKMADDGEKANNESGDGREKSAIVTTGAKDIWSSVWSVLRAAGFTAYGEVPDKRWDMWSVGVGVLWGLARICKGVLTSNEDEVKALMDLCEATKENKIKVQCIGALGCLAQMPDAIDANKAISLYLLSHLRSPKLAEPTLQAASEIVDIYADETVPYDVNFVAGGYLKVLSESLSGIKKVLKTIDQKKDGGWAARKWGDGVVTNLRDFIKYRRALEK